MPCDTRQTSTVEFGDSTDPTLLAQALRGMGYQVTHAGSRVEFSTYAVSGTFANGTLTQNALVGSELDLKVLKRAYSAEIIKAAAQRFGWKVKEAGPNKFAVQRRG